MGLQRREARGAPPLVSAGIVAVRGVRGARGEMRGARGEAREVRGVWGEVREVRGEARTAVGLLRLLYASPCSSTCTWGGSGWSLIVGGKAVLVTLDF